MDQSGSISGTDPHDSRIQAAKLFLKALGRGDEVLLAAFADDGEIPHRFTQYSENFTTNGEAYFPALDALADLEGGGTPLYDAIHAYTNVVSSKGYQDNKAVIVFTDGEDTASGSTLGEVISQAVNLGVRVYPVGLKEVNLEKLTEMAQGTGGAFMWATDARQLVALYGTLANILRNEVLVYQTRWSVTRNGSAFTSGSWFSTSVVVDVPNHGKLGAPFRVQIP
jgi:uncharacterized protein with von Willebrand factor type A (vWA) domain